MTSIGLNILIWTYFNSLTFFSFVLFSWFKILTSSPYCSIHEFNPRIILRIQWQLLVTALISRLKMLIQINFVDRSNHTEDSKMVLMPSCLTFSIVRMKVYAINFSFNKDEISCINLLFDQHWYVHALESIGERRLWVDP